MTVVTCDCGSRMSHKAVCGSKKAKYESQIGLSLMHESQIHPGFACKAVCKQIIESLRSLMFCMFQGDLFAEPLTSSDSIGYLAHTSPPMVSTPGRKAAPLCAAFAFYAICLSRESREKRRGSPGISTRRAIMKIRGSSASTEAEASLTRRTGSPLCRDLWWEANM